MELSSPHLKSFSHTANFYPTNSLRDGTALSKEMLPEGGDERQNSKSSLHLEGEFFVKLTWKMHVNIMHFKVEKIHIKVNYFPMFWLCTLFIYLLLNWFQKNYAIPLKSPCRTFIIAKTFIWEIMANNSIMNSITSTCLWSLVVVLWPDKQYGI